MNTRAAQLLFILIAFCKILPAQDVAIGLPSMNVLYIGPDNAVEIAVNGYKTKKLIKVLSNGDVIEKDGKTYLRVYQRGETILRVGVKKHGKIKWLREMKFRVRMIPHPQPQIGTLTDGSVEKLSTIKANATRVYMGLGDGFARAETRCYVKSYSITLIDSNTFETFTAKGNVIPLEVRSKISRLSPGGKIILSDVYFDMVNNDTVFLRNEKADRFPFTEITVLPDISSSSFDGGFIDTGAIVFYNSYRDNRGAFTDFTGKTKHGVWNYYTGYCPKRLWGQELYDSGRLQAIKVWDSSGFLCIDAAKSKYSDSIFIKELYGNGKTKREGWAITNYKNYNFEGEIKFYGQTTISNPYFSYYNTMKLIPVDEWREYHPNGQLKCKAIFTAITGNPSDNYYYIDDDSQLPPYTIVPDGTWEIFDEAGSKTKEYLYDKGELIK
jgi:hypothetical protein